MNRIWCFLVLGLVLIFADSSGAQPAISDCRLMKSDTDRLKCFDQSANPTSKHEWQIKDDRDPVDDGKLIIASLQDETGKAKFEIGCKQFPDGKSFLLANVALPQFFMSGPGASITYRINSEPAVEGERWAKFPITAGTLWILEPYQFFERLKDNDSLFIRVRHLASEFRSQEARFNLTNVSSTWKMLSTNCPAPPAKASGTVPASPAKSKALPERPRRLPTVAPPLKLN
jgi:hypothetical protein